MAIIPVRDQAHWHELRAENIGGSDVAVILGLSPYKSKWQLWMEKSGKLPAEDLSQNKAVQAGTFLEAGIAQWAAHLWDMNISKVTDYYTVDSVPGMGASLDYINDAGEPVEIKWSARGHGWDYEGDTLVDAPEYYIIQVQHQMACVNAQGGWLIALVDNEPRRMYIPRHDGIIDAIESSITEFWDSIRDGVEPDPDFSLDGDGIAKLMERLPRAEVELDSDAAELFEKYKDAMKAEKQAKADKESSKAEIMHLASFKLAVSNGDKDKPVIRCGDHKMSVSFVQKNPGKVVTPEMVGTYINAREGYTTARVS